MISSQFRTSVVVVVVVSAFGTSPRLADAQAMRDQPVAQSRTTWIQPTTPTEAPQAASFDERLPWQLGGLLLMQGLATGAGLWILSSDDLSVDCGLANSWDDAFCSGFATVFAGFGYFALSAIGVAGGVSAGGDLAGGNGDFGATLVGAIAGTGLGLAAVAGLSEYNEVDFDKSLRSPLGVIALALLPGVGAFAGYELSHRRNTRRPEFILQPVLQVDPKQERIVIGLGGGF